MKKRQASVSRMSQKIKYRIYLNSKVIKYFRKTPHVHICERIRAMMNLRYGWILPYELQLTDDLLTENSIMQEKKDPKT